LRWLAYEASFDVFKTMIFKLAPKERGSLVAKVLILLCPVTP